MKKFFGFLAILGFVVSVSGNVFAAEVLPIKKINFCGTEYVPTGVNNVLSVSNDSIRCNVQVELVNSNYTVVSGQGDTDFDRSKMNHIVLIQDTNGNTTRYTFTVNYTVTGNNNSNNNESNPSTGDNQVLYLGIALVSVSIIALSYNRIIKYSKVD